MSAWRTMVSAWSTVTCTHHTSSTMAHPREPLQHSVTRVVRTGGALWCVLTSSTSPSAKLAFARRYIALVLAASMTRASLQNVRAWCMYKHSRVARVAAFDTPQCQLTKHALCLHDAPLTPASTPLCLPSRPPAACIDVHCPTAPSSSSTSQCSSCSSAAHASSLPALPVLSFGIWSHA